MPVYPAPNENPDCLCVHPMQSMFCRTGHMTECHYPHTCTQAECGHWMRQKELDEECAEAVAPDLGPCCVCEGTDGVRNILTLHKVSPMEGRGWGNVEIGMPVIGAIAVTCDGCLNTWPTFACRGYPGEDGRIPIDELEELPAEWVERLDRLREEEASGG